MSTLSDRHYPGHQRDIGHTLQLTLSALQRLEADPETGERRFGDADELQLACALLRELKTAVAFCTMAENGRWADELPTNLKVLCDGLAFTLVSLGVVDDEATAADEDEDDLDEADDIDETPAHPLTLPEIALLVDEQMRAWAQSVNVLLPQFA
jgi:hypothetical protein